MRTPDKPLIWIVFIRHQNWYVRQYQSYGPYPLLSFLVLFLVAAVGCAVLLAVLIRVLPRRFLAADVNARSNHEVEARQIGGLAVIPVALVLLACFGPGFGLPTGSLLLVLSAALLLWLIGFLDDRSPQPVSVRFLAQGVAAALCVYALPEGLRVLPDAIPIVIERALLFLGLVYFINIVNFMDGLDLMVVSGLGLPLMALGLFAAIGLAGAGAGTFATILAGALAGFALFNKPKARVFLGDSGSLPLGLLAAMALILAVPTLGLAAVLILPLYFLADATATLIKRLIAGENILASHSQHAYQNAKRSGWPVARIILSLTALNVILALCALLVAWAPNLPVTLAGAAAALAATIVILLRFRSRPLR